MGTQIDDVKDLDQKYMVDEEEFKEKVKKQHEAKGGDSMNYYLQPFSRPELSDLVGRQIDVYSQFNTVLLLLLVLANHLLINVVHILWLHRVA